MEFLKNNKLRRTWIINDDGLAVAIVRIHYIDPKTRQWVGDSKTAFRPIVWSRGYRVEWINKEIEIFKNLAEIHDKYNFTNFPGPNGVLRRTKRHKTLNNVRS